jgi:hypothetical protein
MRVLARISCTLAGLALAAPAAATADDAYSTTAPAPAKAPHKHRWSLFGGERLCAECQRAKVKAKDGVDVPPPPPLPGPAVNGGACVACGTPTQVMASHGNVTVSPMMPGTAPGMASVGGDPVGYAAVGNDPAPIGMYEPRLAAAAPVRGPAGAQRDSAVTASGYSPTTVSPMPSNRPHVLSHLLGVSAIGRDAREARERRREEKHASIPYGTQTSAVNDVPAKVVYGR